MGHGPSGTKGARAHGLTREQAERDYFVTIGRVLDTERFPNAAAEFDAVRAVPATDARQDFEFGLARILDGVEALARERERMPVGRRKGQLPCEVPEIAE